jgi:hypothetical protein
MADIPHCGSLASAFLPTPFFGILQETKAIDFQREVRR